MASGGDLLLGRYNDDWVPLVWPGQGTRMKGHWCAIGYLEEEALAAVRVAVVMKPWHDHAVEAWKSIGYACGKALVPALQHCEFQAVDLLQMFDVLKFGFVDGFSKSV